MGLVVSHKRGRNYPVLICDACGKEIEYWQKAIVSWDRVLDGTMSDVNTYHRGECDPHKRFWMSLDQYIPWLISNHKCGKKHRSKAGKKFIMIEVPEPLEL